MKTWSPLMGARDAVTMVRFRAGSLLDAHLIRHREATFLIRMQGDELQEKGIQDGDLLVVDRNAAPSTGSFVVTIRAEQWHPARVGRDAQGQRVLHTAQNVLLEPGPGSGCRVHRVGT
jgi:SOS-response transcriptional repressor LexA